MATDHSTPTDTQTGTRTGTAGRAQQKTPAEAFAEFAQHFQVAMAPIAQHMQMIMDQVSIVWRERIYPQIHAAYLANGAPYGDTNDGLLRWMRDMGEVRRHLDAIEAIRTRQWAIADFRRQLQTKREAE